MKNEIFKLKTCLKVCYNIKKGQKMKEVTVEQIKMEAGLCVKNFQLVMIKY